MSEEAKAAKALADASGKAIDAGREFGGFISTYVGGALEQAMGIFEDKLKYIRWERQVRLMERANALLAERGLDRPTRKIPLQVAIPLLQGGSLEEDNSLQDRWAMLLVNAGDASAEAEVRRAFVSILEDLSPLDAIVLEKIYDPTLVFLDRREVWTTYLPDHASAKKPDVDDLLPTEEVHVSLGNLVRLGLLNSAMAWSGYAIPSCVYQTVLGQEFVRAITSPPAI
jgi:hypothetical protein